MPARNICLSFALVIITFVYLLSVCSDKKAVAPLDSTPPARTSNLTAINPTDSSITLQWTSPGDDADTGMAYAYDLRFSIYPITDSSWDSASIVSGLPTPQLVGYLEEHTVTGLTAATRYFFALKTADEIPSWSPLSNISTARTAGRGNNQWSALGSGLNAPGEALTTFNGNLIVGGLFMEAGGIMANHVAAWDDSAWSNLGQGVGGMNGTVTSLAIYNDMIVASGRFGGPGASIMVWDGSSWSPLGTGFNDIVRCLTVYDGSLIAGGNFTSKGSLVANHIISWDGSTWMPLGDGLNENVGALYVNNNQLIVGGGFNMAGDSTVQRIASWDGVNWHPLGAGISGGMHTEVNSMTEYNGILIVGGVFSTAGGISASNIAAWDGASWTALGSGTDNAINGLAVFGNMLIAGGDFMTAGGNPVNRIASWDGTIWAPLDSGLNGDVSCLIVYNDRLISAGNFQAAGEIEARHIAAWSQTARF